MGTVLALRSAGEVLEDGLLQRRRELAAHRGVHPPECADRVAEEVEVLQVGDLIRRQGGVGRRGVEDHPESEPDRGRHRMPVDGAGADAATHRDSARGGRDRLHGVPMGADHERVGIHVEQRRQSGEVHRRLEDPPGRLAGLEHLQEAAVEPIGDGVVPGHAPGAERRHGHAGRPVPRVELRREHPEALLGKAGLEVVHGTELGSDVAPQVELALGPGGARGVVDRGARMRHLVGEGGTQPRVEGEQFVEDARPRTSRSGDHDRSDHWLGCQLGTAAVGVEHGEPGGEVSDQVVAAHQTAHHVQLGLAVEGGRDPSERLDPGGFTEVVEAGGPPGVFDQLVRFERHQGTRAADARRESVHPTNPRRTLVGQIGHGGTVRRPAGRNAVGALPARAGRQPVTASVGSAFGSSTTCFEPCTRRVAGTLRRTNTIVSSSTAADAQYP